MGTGCPRRPRGQEAIPEEALSTAAWDLQAAVIHQVNTTLAHATQVAWDTDLTVNEILEDEKECLQSLARATNRTFEWAERTVERAIQEHRPDESAPDAKCAHRHT